MLHPSYELYRSNPWWGPEPQEGKVAVVQFVLPKIGSGHISLVDAESRYDVLASIMPTEQWPKFIEKEAAEVDYSLAWAPSTARLDQSFPLSDKESRWKFEYDNQRLRHVMTSVAYLSGNARLGEGVRFLNYLQASMREVLGGESNVFPPADDRISPYQPHGLFEYVPPSGPFDLRVRAKATVPKTRPTTGRLEDLLLNVALKREGKSQYPPFYEAGLVTDCDDPRIAELRYMSRETD